MSTPSEDHFQFNLSQDHADLLLALNARGAKYLVVGGYAFGAYLQPRATKDLDIFILSDSENANAVFCALADFGAPLAGLQPSDFDDGKSYFQMGEPPMRVDVLQTISGVTFDECWRTREIGMVNGAFEVPVISLEKLIQNKRAAGRRQDLLDLDEIERKAALLKRYPEE
jgi:hypothetical protein